MSRFRDEAVTKIELAERVTYGENARALTAQAQVYALLDVADAIRTQKGNPNV